MINGQKWRNYGWAYQLKVKSTSALDELRIIKKFFAFHDKEADIFFQLVKNNAQVGSKENCII